MRKLTILTALAALVAASGGCSSCIGRCRNLFHKGSPCGTAMAPAVLGAPLAMGTPVNPAPVIAGPVMAGPICVPQAPVCVPADPCYDPCADPCANGMMTMGYGGYVSGDGCGCADGPVTTTPMTTVAPGTTIVSPTPMGDQ